MRSAIANSFRQYIDAVPSRGDVVRRTCFPFAEWSYGSWDDDARAPPLAWAFVDDGAWSSEVGYRFARGSLLGWRAVADRSPVIKQVPLSASSSHDDEPMSESNPFRLTSRIHLVESIASTDSATVFRARVAIEEDEVEEDEVEDPCDAYADLDGDQWVDCAIKLMAVDCRNASFAEWHSTRQKLPDGTLRCVSAWSEPIAMSRAYPRAFYGSAIFMCAAQCRWYVCVAMPLYQGTLWTVGWQLLYRLTLAACGTDALRSPHETSPSTSNEQPSHVDQQEEEDQEDQEEDQEEEEDQDQEEEKEGTSRLVLGSSAVLPRLATATTRHLHTSEHKGGGGGGGGGGGHRENACLEPPCERNAMPAALDKCVEMKNQRDDVQAENEKENDGDDGDEERGAQIADELLDCLAHVVLYTIPQAKSRQRLVAHNDVKSDNIAFQSTTRKHVYVCLRLRQPFVESTSHEKNDEDGEDQASARFSSWRHRLTSTCRHRGRRHPHSRIIEHWLAIPTHGRLFRLIDFGWASVRASTYRIESGSCSANWDGSMDAWNGRTDYAQIAYSLMNQMQRAFGWNAKACPYMAMARVMKRRRRRRPDDQGRNRAETTLRRCAARGDGGRGRRQEDRRECGDCGESNEGEDGGGGGGGDQEPCPRWWRLIDALVGLMSVRSDTIALHPWQHGKVGCDVAGGNAIDACRAMPDEREAKDETSHDRQRATESVVLVVDRHRNTPEEIREETQDEEKQKSVRSRAPPSCSRSGCSTDCQADLCTSRDDGVKDSQHALWNDLFYPMISNQCHLEFSHAFIDVVVSRYITAPICTPSSQGLPSLPSLPHRRAIVVDWPPT